MKGVIQRVYDAYRTDKGLPRQTVRNITDAEVRDIYKTRYWDLVKGDTLPAGVDLATFDFGVNSGVSRANQYRARITSGTPAEVAKKLCQARLAFVRALSTFSVFGKGWTRRITTIEARSVKMALEAAGQSPGEVAGSLRKESAKANKAAKQQGAGAAGAAGAGGAGGTQVDPSALDFTSTVGLVVAAIVVGAIVIFLIKRARENRERAKAYAKVAAEPTS